MSNNNTFFNIAFRLGLREVGDSFSTGSYFHNPKTGLRLTIRKITGDLGAKAHFWIEIHYAKQTNECLFSGQWSGQVIDLQPLVCRFLTDCSEFHCALLSAGTQSAKKKFLHLYNNKTTLLGW